MPKVRIYNRTKKQGSVLPNGVAVAIRAGAIDTRGEFAGEPQEIKVQVGNVAEYDVASSFGFKITVAPTNTMIQGANFVQKQGELTKDIDLYIIPAAQAYGVEISFEKPDTT